MIRVLLIFHNPLFAHSVHAVLLTHPQFELVGEIDDWMQAAAEIERLTPDVVIIEEDVAEAADSALRALRAQQAPWRVVAMRLDETAMRIWSGTWQTVTRTQDVIDAMIGPPTRHD